MSVLFENKLPVYNKKIEEKIVHSIAKLLYIIRIGYAINPKLVGGL